MPHRIDRNRRAFTLVELLVVIGIIALLVSILLPVLNKAKAAADTVKCMAQMKQITTAMIMYTGDNKGRFCFPPSIGEGYPQAGKPMAYYMDTRTSLGVIRYDVGLLWPYLTSAANKTNPNTIAAGPKTLQTIMNCPADNEAMRSSAINGGNNNQTVPRNFSYSWNVLIRGDTNVTGDVNDVASKINQIRSSSNKIILIEEAEPNDGLAYCAVKDQDDTPAFYHNHRGNYGFADGHVETLHPADLGYKEVPNQGTHAIIVDQRRVDHYFKLTSSN